MDLMDALDQMYDHGTKVVAAVRPDQLGDGTPCRDWTVRDLLTHTTGIVANIGKAARGEAVDGDPNEFALGDDVGGQFRAVAAGTLDAWKARGTEGEMDIGGGAMPAHAALCVNLVDTCTHLWDIARATGQDVDLPPDLAATVLEVAHGLVDDGLRGRVGIGPPVPVGADAAPADQLAAFMGRQP